MPATPQNTRRSFLRGAAFATAGLVTASGSQSAIADAEPSPPDNLAKDRDGLPHPPRDNEKAKPHPSTEVPFPRTHPGRGGPIGSPSDRGKLVSGLRGPGLPPVAVEMPDIPTLPWTMVGGVKEFHLIAEHVRREFLPNMWFDCWGFNGTMPGPLIEAVQGDRVRLVVHNELPEPTTVHWHGLELPIRFDGVPGVTQDPIQPGKQFAYEFDLHQDGTFFYHSHGPMQEIMGMMGLFVIHPKEPYLPTVDRDFGLVMNEFAILPQNTIPNSMSMEFNFFTSPTPAAGHESLNDCCRRRGDWHWRVVRGSDGGLPVRSLAGPRIVERGPSPAGSRRLDGIGPARCPPEEA